MAPKQEIKKSGLGLLYDFLACRIITFSSDVVQRSGNIRFWSLVTNLLWIPE